jgi:hypothetical protein
MYTVTLRFQYPAWDEKDGITYSDILARSKSEAVKFARQDMRRDGHLPASGKGLTWVTATEQ